MKIQEKYYTPKKEEYRIGFEYEINDTWGSFMKVVFEDFGLVAVGSGNDRVPYDYQARVKYLDQEDILSLGWEVTDFAKHIYRKDDFTLVFFVNTFEVANIYIRQEQGYGQTGFKGMAKNKNELKVIMKQLGL